MTKQLTTEATREKINAEGIINRSVVRSQDTMDLEVPEWGAVITIRRASTQEVLDLPKEPVPLVKGLMQACIAEPRFTSEQIERLFAFESQDVILRVAEAIKAFNSMGVAKEEVARPFPVQQNGR